VVESVYRIYILTTLTFCVEQMGGRIREEPRKAGIRRKEEKREGAKERGGTRGIGRQEKGRNE
jgi:hypothetical protein